MIEIQDSKGVRATGTNAFTLVELLVVIGIIGLLMAILLPTLRMVQIAARQTACASNMRQIGLASAAYASDNHGLLPWCGVEWFENFTIRRGLSWDDLLDPYLGNRLSPDERELAASPRDNPVLRCPADIYPAQPLAVLNQQPPYFKRSYSMSFRAVASPLDHGCYFEGVGGEDTIIGSWGAVDFSGLKPYLNISVTAIHNPSEVLAVIERPDQANIQGAMALAGAANPMNQTTGWSNTFNMLSQGSARVFTLHDHQWNYLFIDGHVSLLHMEDTVRPTANYINTLASQNFMWTRRTDD